MKGVACGVRRERAQGTSGLHSFSHSYSSPATSTTAVDDDDDTPTAAAAAAAADDDDSTADNSAAADSAAAIVGIVVEQLPASTRHGHVSTTEEAPE